MFARLGSLVAFLLLGVAPATANCRLAKVIDLPVTLQGMQPLTDVTMNGHPVRLMVDSGAFFSLITPGSAAELALPQHSAPVGFYLTGLGGRVDPMVGTVRDFSVGSVTLHNLEFLVGGSEIGSTGVLGQNILHFRDVEYDLGAGMVRLMDSHDCGHANLAYWAKPNEAVSIVPLEPVAERGVLNQHTVGKVLVNGIPMRALFDTGASRSSLTLAAAARAGVHPNDAGVESAGMSGGIGRHFLRAWIAPFRSVNIGGEEIRGTRLRIVDVSDADWDVLLGADFFLSHHVYVANGLRRLFLTYNGGQVFQLRNISEEAADAAPPTGALAAPAAESGPADTAAVPTDAAGFARRGAARLARRDVAGALADLNEAVKRAPDQPRFLLDRARLHMALRQPLLAGNDLDAAIKLSDDADTRLTRAVLRLRAHDRDGALEDVDAAAKLAPRPADARLDLGTLYSDLDRFPQAVEQYSLWIAAHPDDARRGTALNDRCWARALGNLDLPEALADCDGALHRMPNSPGFLDSRGLVRLRLGQYDAAIADYGRALAAQPRLPWSLYGRGLAKIAKGDAAGGKADIAAAVAIEPDLPARARRYGLVPPA